MRLLAEQRAQEEIHLSNLKKGLGNRKIRVLYANQCLVAGGLEKCIWLMGRGLDKKVFEPELNTTYGGKWEGIMSKVMPIHKAENMEDLIDREGFDLLHIFNVPDLYYLWKKVVFIETVAGYGAIFLKNGDKSGLDRLIFCSSKIKNTLIPLINVNGERVEVMANPVDLDKPVIGGKLKKRLGIVNRKLIGWVGRLSHEKNPELFLDVANALYKDYSFVVIGEAWKPELNIEFLEKMKCSRADIHWIRDVDPNEITDYIKDLTLLCNTSYTEGHPLTILEAMAVKVPVVSLCAGSVSDIINDNTGYLVYREEDYINTVRKALKEDYKKVNNAYAHVLMNHNLRDYIRKMEIIYLEDFFKYKVRRGYL